MNFEFSNLIQNINTVLAVLGVLLFFLVAIFLYRKKQKAKEVPGVGTQEGVVGGSKKKDDKQKLTMQERIELSWKFLYEITELIISKFSREDKELLNKLGHTLLDNGVRYEHVVDLAMQRPVSKAQNIEQQTHGQSQQTLGI